MKHVLQILSTVLIGISIVYAQPYSVNLKVSIPTDCNGGTDILLYNKSGLEGQEFLIPEQTLPAQFSSFQSYYDVFAGGIVGLQPGTLNENVTLNVNLEFFKCSPDNPQLLELIRMSIVVVGENTGSHDVFTYYNFNEGKKAFIKLKAQKLFDYLQNASVTLDELVAWFYGEGFTPDLTGITYQYSDTDPDWFYIYLNHFSKIILGTMASPTEVMHSDQLPENYNLAQNYPNPFNPSTTINFSLPKESNVNLRVFDLLGQEIISLVHNEFMIVGTYSYKFDASSLTSGTYIYKLEAGEFVQTKKMTLIK
jgi:hypothetical protein